MLSVIIELLFTASNIEVLGVAKKLFYGEFISPVTVKPTEVCTLKSKVHRCTGTEALYRPYGP